MVKKTFLLFVNLIVKMTVFEASAIRVWSGSIAAKVLVCFAISIFTCLCLARAITTIEQLEVTTTTNLFFIFFYLLSEMLP